MNQAKMPVKAEKKNAMSKRDKKKTRENYSALFLVSGCYSTINKDRKKVKDSWNKKAQDGCCREQHSVKQGFHSYKSTWAKRTILKLMGGNMSF